MKIGATRGDKRKRTQVGLIGEYLAELDMIPHGNTQNSSQNKSLLVERYASEAGVSVKTWYRHVQKYEQELAVMRERSVRTDRGESYLSRDMVLAIEEIRYAAANTKANKPLPMDLAIRKAVQRGILDKEIPVSTVNRKARELGLRQMEAFRTLETLRPNEIHHIDATGSMWFEVIDIVKDDHDEFVDYKVHIRQRPNERNNKEWKKNGGMNLWRVHLVDDYSGCMYGEYVVGLGESAFLTMQVIEQAWRGDPEVPFMHLPRAVNIDHGALQRRVEFPAFFQRLEVEVMPRMPHQKQVGGKVENSFSRLKYRFEQFFSDRPGDVMLLSELNAEARRWTMEENCHPHRYEQSKNRAEVYSRITSDSEIRAVPDNLLSAMYRTFTRKVRADATIGVDAKVYKVDWKLIGKTVLVFRDLQENICMTDPLDPLGRVVQLKEGRRSTIYFDSKRPEKWQHRYKPSSHPSEKLREYDSKRKSKDQDGWQIGEAGYPAKTDNIVTMPVERPKVDMPSPVETARQHKSQFRSRSEARLWVFSEGLRMAAPEVPIAVRQRIDELLERTLDREKIAAWCSRVRTNNRAANN